MDAMKRPESKFRLTLLVTLVAFLGAVAVCWIFEQLGFPEQNQVKMIRDMAGWNRTFVLTVAWVLAGTPVVEECLFRLLLFRLPSRLLSKEEPLRFFDFHAQFVCAILSSAVFSFAHYIDFASLFAGRGFALTPVSNAFFALFLLGFTWCWLYRLTGAIWCNMLSHSLFNAANLVFLFFV